MHKLIGVLVAIVLWALALVAAQPSFGAFSALSAMADTSGGNLVCVTPSLNPHPTSPVGQSTDTVFCSPAPTAAQSGTGTNGNGSGGSTNGGSGTRGTTTTAAGSGSGGQVQPASGSTNGSTLTAANGNDATGDQSAVKTGPKSSANSNSPNSGLFGGLVAFLGSAGGLGLLFAFLILLAIVLFIVGVIGWLRRRDGATWGSRFARVAHRA